MNQELGIRNYGLRGRFNSLIRYSLFLILAATLLVAAPAQAAGSCSRLGNDPTGPCYLECRNASSAGDCNESAPTWAPTDCDLIRRCQQGSFTGSLLGTPGSSCYKIQNQQEQKECRKTICAEGYICNFGVCTFGTEDRAATDSAITAPGALPCNYTLDDLLQTGVNFANLLFGITGSLMLVFILYGGYQMFTSMGNAEAIQKARQTLTMAFVGFIIVVGASLFVRFAADLVGGSFENKAGGALGETVLPRGSCVKQETDRQGSCVSACVPANRPSSCTEEAPAWLDGPCTLVRRCQ